MKAASSVNLLLFSLFVHIFLNGLRCLGRQGRQRAARNANRFSTAVEKVVRRLSRELGTMNTEEVLLEVAPKAVPHDYFYI